MPSREELKILQSYPLELKIKKTQQRIREWVNYFGVDNVYVSFSGGKDSTVLLHLVRQMFPSVLACFCNTGLEYPEIQKFVQSFENVTILYPEMRFDEVISKYGYPFIGKEVAECLYQGKIALHSNKYPYRLAKLFGTAKDKNGNKSLFNLEKWQPLLYVDFNISSMCCVVNKKKPNRIFSRLTGKFPMTAQLAEESRLREQQWLKNGCNGFDMKSPISNPLSFWLEQDILQYIKQNNLPIASVYGDVVYGNRGSNELYDNLLCDCGQELCTTGCERTGCIYCAYGIQYEVGESRFQMLKRTHPKQYSYCMNGGGYDTDGLWKPTKEGLGMRHCIQVINEIYGKDFIKY